MALPTTDCIVWDSVEDEFIPGTTTALFDNDPLSVPIGQRSEVNGRCLSLGDMLGYSQLQPMENSARSSLPSSTLCTDPSFEATNSDTWVLPEVNLQKPEEICAPSKVQDLSHFSVAEEFLGVRQTANTVRATKNVFRLFSKFVIDLVCGPSALTQYSALASFVRESNMVSSAREDDCELVSFQILLYQNKSCGMLDSACQV